MSNHILANHRAGAHQVRNSKIGNHPLDSVQHHVGLAPRTAGNPAEPSLEFPVGGQNGAEQIFRPGQDVVFASVPALRRDIEGVVIWFLGLLDDPLKVAVATNFVAVVVEEQKKETVEQ